MPTNVFASTPLASESPGTIITFSSKQWTIINHMPDGSTYIILNENDGHRAFDPDNTQLFNPPDSNNIGWYLNNTFYDSLSQKHLIKTHNWERKFENGTGSQTNVNANIGLLSYGEYETHRNLFPEHGASYSWWLRTPHSLDSTAAWRVNDYGGLIGGWPHHNFGVRPTLYLVSGIFLDTSKNVIGTEPPPATPSGLNISNITQTSATASWNAVTGATEYRVYLNGSLIATTTSTSRNLTGLSPETTYQVQVSAVGPGGEGAKASKTFTTLAHQPGTPSGLNISNITQTSATASWNAVTGATEYRVYLNGSLITTTTSLSHNLTGLSPETTYQIQVSAVGPGGEGAKASKNFKTFSPVSPNTRDTFEWFKFFMVAFATWLMPFVAAFIGIVVLALIWKIWRKYSNG